ncbi:hypothetical protein DU504_13310 [Haloplanus salinus]|uniref:Uncharacterized protein n=1 Tax=Haloplanus salinus TaxID=1126245 RepID=A0A368NCH3_9EURY|nr:hypothetical protein DU504_13310 [Haloplanus salinus]
MLVGMDKPVYVLQRGDEVTRRSTRPHCVSLPTGGAGTARRST